MGREYIVNRKRTHQASFTKEIRLWLGINKNEMAKLLRVSAQFYGRIESGAAPIPTKAMNILIKKRIVSSWQLIEKACLDLRDSMLSKLK